MSARLRARDEDGLTLVELLVGMMVTSILLAIVGTLFVSVATTTYDANAITAKGSIGTNIMDATSKVIRTAVSNPTGADSADPAIVSGTPSSLTIYSYVDATSSSGIAGELVPTRVAFSVDAKKNLIEERVLGTKSAGYWTFTGAATKRSIGGPVLTPTGDTALFVYFDADGNEVSLTATSDADTRATVTSIRVTVQLANQGTRGSDPILLKNTIVMINLKPSNLGKK